MVKPDDLTDLQPSEAGIYHDLFADDRFARDACSECKARQDLARVRRGDILWGKARCKLHRWSVRHG